MADKKKPLTPAEYFKKIGKQDRDAIIDLEGSKIPETISTGSWVINYIIGDGTGQGKAGGFPKGAVVEITGDESAGKTTLALSACRKVQEAGGVPVYFDFERSFHKIYAQNLGLDISSDKFVLAQPDTFEDGARMIEDALEMEPALIVVDSVAAMTPKAFVEGDIDEGARIGLHASLMSKFMSIISKSVKRSNTCLCLINQMRSRIKGQYERGPTEESTGGRSLKYYITVKLMMEKGAMERINTKSGLTGKMEKKAVNMTVKVSCIKNKFDRPFLSGPVYIRFGEGFDNLMSMAELAITTGVIKKSGAFYRFDDGDTTLFNVQGKEGLRRKLIAEVDLRKMIEDRISIKEDAQVKEEYKDENDAEMPEEKGDIASQLSTVSEKFKKKGKGKK